MKDVVLMEEDKKYIANTYKRFDVVLDHGQGSVLFDVNGKKYIDLGSGIAVSSFGVSDPEVVKAICDQAGKLTHTSNLYYTEPQIKLAKLLCEKTGFEKVFFSNSGAEANECAIKCARKYSVDKYGKNRNVIISLAHSFHGRTVTTLSATGQDEYHTDFYPFTEGFVFVEANDTDALIKAAENKNVCGIMMETVQGEGGVNALEDVFVKCAAELCEKNDLILIIDEVQTGNGRSGKYFAFENYGIKPDVVSTAKGLAGGLPMGATLFSAKTAGVLTYGKHGSTFGGNPVAAAAALSVVSRITDGLLAGVRERSEYIKKALGGAKNLTEITGMGLMLGIKTSKPAKDIVAYCQSRGVLVLTAKDKVRLLPALNIPMDQLEEAIGILRKGIEE